MGLCTVSAAYSPYSRYTVTTQNLHPLRHPMVKFPLFCETPIFNWPIGLSLAWHWVKWGQIVSEPTMNPQHSPWVSDPRLCHAPDIFHLSFLFYPLLQDIKTSLSTHIQDKTKHHWLLWDHKETTWRLPDYLTTLCCYHPSPRHHCCQLPQAPHLPPTTQQDD